MKTIGCQACCQLHNPGSEGDFRLSGFSPILCAVFLVTRSRVVSRATWNIRGSGLAQTALHINWLCNWRVVRVAMTAGFVYAGLERIFTTRLLPTMNRRRHMRVMPATAHDAVYQHGKHCCDNKEQTAHEKNSSRIGESVLKCRSARPEPQYQFPPDSPLGLAAGVPGSVFLRWRHLRKVHPIPQMSFRRMRQK